MTIKINGTNTTAQPSITGTDTDTGLVYGTDEVKIVTGGTEKVKVDGSGNVGIGTGSPAADLHVKDSSSSGQILVEDVNGGRGYFVAQTNGEIDIYRGNEGTGANKSIRLRADDSAGTIQFQTGGSSERMRIDANGYVTKSTCAAVRVGRQSPTVTIAPNNKFQFNQKGGSYHFDADNLWDTTNHRYTAPVDGLYSVSYQCIVETLANGANVIDLINTRINGVNVGYSIRRALYVLNTTGSAGYFSDFFYATYELSAGDTVEFFNGSPSTVVMHANDNYNVLHIYLIG